MARGCRHEAEVLDAVLSDRWPDGCRSSLVAHVEACDLCRDLAMVASILHQDCEAVKAASRVPTAGVVWWRAQVRARAEDERRAMRPMLVAAACGLTALVALGAAALTLGMPWLSGPLSDTMRVGLGAWPAIALTTDADVLAGRWIVYAVLAVVLLVAAPIAVVAAAWDRRA